MTRATLDPTAAPPDVPAAIRQVKAKLRAQVGDVSGAVADVEDQMRAEVGEIVALRECGEAIWPVVRFEDVLAGTVPAALADAIRRRGCAVVKNTFSRERAEEWDRELVSYLEQNEFETTYRYLDDGVFGGLAAGKPSIFPIYWSRPQTEARQDANMVRVRAFLNSFWRHESEGRLWFDPARDTAYPDRVRRRGPDANSAGLSPHVDSGSIERWMLGGYQRVYRHVFSGDFAAFDPWDGAYRTEVYEFESTVMCSALRTFQGWTALSDMQPTQGVLHAVPIPTAIAYVLLRALQDDVADDDLCGAENGRALPVTERWHSVLLPALTPIPAVEPGDTVWWHCDLIHSVGEVTDQAGWGNVMYIPASPLCEKNAAYAKKCGQAFLAGASPPDFAPEHYEVSWTGRATLGDLSGTGRRQLGLDTLALGEASGRSE